MIKGVPITSGRLFCLFEIKLDRKLAGSFQDENKDNEYNHIDTNKDEDISSDQ